MSWNSTPFVPEKEGRYLASDGNNIEIMHYFGMHNGHPHWSSHECKTIKVKCWMDLPKLPEKDEE